MNRFPCLPLAILAALAACSGSSVRIMESTVVPGRADERTVPAPLRYGAGLRLGSWDPNGSAGWCEATSLLHARLFTVDGEGRAAGDLVETWAASDDGLEVTLDLRAAATFHDGTPVRAGDVVATFAALPRHAASEVRSHLAPVREMAAAGERRIVIRLAHPLPELPEILTEMAVHPAARLAGDPKSLEEAPVGAGPYRLVVPGEGVMEFAAHAGHHAGAPAIAAVELRLIEDDRERARALARGEIDLACVKLESLASFADRRRFRVQAFESGVIRALPFDIRAPGLDDARVRRALSALIDRDAIVRETLGGHGRAAYQILAPRNEAFDPALDRPAMSPEAAEALLDEAGWRRGADGLRARDGLPLQVRLVAWQGEAFRRRSVEMVVAGWRARGIAAEVLPVDHAGYRRLTEDLHGHAEGYIGGWGALAAPVSVLARKFTAAGGQNRSGFSDPEVERLLAGAAREPRLGPRVELVREAGRRLAELVPWAPVAYAENIFVASTRLERIPFRVVDSWYEFPRLFGALRWQTPE